MKVELKRKYRGMSRKRFVGKKVKKEEEEKESRKTKGRERTTIKGKKEGRNERW